MRNIFYQLQSIIILSLFIFVTLSSCGNKSAQNKQNDKIVASVYDRNLYLSDIKFPNSRLVQLSKKDSAALAKSYIEHWVRKSLLSMHVQKQIDDFDKIEKLVEDYKNSLIIAEFKQNYIKNNLDTNISSQDLNNFYNENKNNYKLKNKIINLRYAKIAEKTKRLDKFYEDWKKNRINNILAYTKKNSDSYFIAKDMWYNYDSIKSEIPTFMLKNKDKYDLQINKKGFEYFIKVKGIKHKNDITPLILIQDKLKQLILKKRESGMIDKYIEDLYKKEIDNNKIKIYSEVI